MALIVNFSPASRLAGTIGTATAQAGGCRCIAFVRAPSQTSSTFDRPGRGTAGEVTFTLVRAPFAARSSHTGAPPEATRNEKDVAEPAAELVQSAVERIVMQDRLPQARFDLVVQILSSVDDDSDIECVAAAACAALVDAAIELHDVFGAAAVPLGAAVVRVIAAAHSGSVVAAVSQGAVAPAALGSAVAAACQKASQTILSALGHNVRRDGFRLGVQ